MKLSPEAIIACSEKYGKGPLCGFSGSIGADVGALPEEDQQRICDELAENELIDLSGEEIHISALGHHILNMMIFPEVFVMVENRVLNVNVRIYIRNAYYLLVLDRRNGTEAAPESKIIIELLPTLKGVVSAFVYALYRSKEKKAETRGRTPHVGTDGEPDHDITITEKAWNKERVLYSDVVWYAGYEGEEIRCHEVKDLTGGKKVEAGMKYPVSDLVNAVTRWVFDRLSDTMREEEDIYGNV